MIFVLQKRPFRIVIFKFFANVNDILGNAGSHLLSAWPGNGGTL
ncbi:hypothetical protein B14911_13072 [Bacillus sp. NRRL B-14911]|nr:hypothetical protein B14911_13072 [Bacillus sp. NRRL B-14911]